MTRKGASAARKKSRETIDDLKSFFLFAYTLLKYPNASTPLGPSKEHLRMLRAKFLANRIQDALLDILNVFKFGGYNITAILSGLGIIIAEVLAWYIGLLDGDLWLVGDRRYFLSGDHPLTLLERSV